MTNDGARQISDPIHGVIKLTPLEVEIIGTRAFQRLRNVKQLGLAHYVYPGADYSRFSHSVGACHVMGRIVDVLADYAAEHLTPKRRQMYRIAALLHDVGHYPFSHATEYAFKNHYSQTLFGGGGATKPVPYIMHESVTGLIIHEDGQIPDILKRADIDPKEVETTIRRSAPAAYLSNLISSDLDADRIDYLLRTAHHAGLPYGEVDVDYLLTQMRLDKDRRVCITSRAIRAADHMLLCRYFDYQQVSFHKAVQGFEWVLKGCISDLVEAERIEGSEEAVKKLVRTGAWAVFDDTSLLSEIRWLRNNAKSPDARLRAECVLDRKPPIVIAQDDKIVRQEELADEAVRKLYVKAMKACAAKFEIPPSRMTLWDPGPLTLTKIGGHVDVGVLATAKSDDKEATKAALKNEDALEQAVRIMNEETKTSTPIQSDKRSLMSVLADHGARPLRIYALLSDDEKKSVAEMKSFIQSET